MNKEFKNLYKNWFNATAILSHSQFEVPEWYELVDWSKEHKEEAVDGIIEILKEEPGWIVQLCDELFPDVLKSEGYIPLEVWCTAWLAILKGYKEGLPLDDIDITNLPNPYEDYDAYHKYLNDHYIPWNPFHEDDPNITLEEFKQGKRNPENHESK